MENLNSGDESDHDLISTEMLQDIYDGGQTHPNVNKREAHYKIRDLIRKKEIGMERRVKSYAKHGKRFTQGIQYVCKRYFTGIGSFGISGSEVSHFIPETRNFAEVKTLLNDIKKPWIKETQKDI